VAEVVAEAVAKAVQNMKGRTLTFKQLETGW
jgi:hypothetical protein